MRPILRPIFLRLAFVALWVALWLGAAAPDMTPAMATAPCGGDFNTWLDGIRQEAAAAGVSQRTIQAALSGLTSDPAVIGHDHAQGVFRQSFEQFSGRM